MPNFAGTWKMKSSENFDELLKALSVNAMLRKVAGAAASKPHVEIRQDGEQFYIKTSTTVRTTEINFRIGEEFDEETVDGRKCKHPCEPLPFFFAPKSLATWENENKMYCTQRLLAGDGPKTYWSRELKGDELILVRSPATPTHESLSFPETQPESKSGEMTWRKERKCVHTLV
ncbi:cellular retinoic acid-binding protein 1-like [Scleropages formosus]|uniref:Cellular retinoic acid-binding protein 1-like n=1 Tax=Scleropages formosus TaxID=113540 RepID=A0A0P7Z6W8_SCLFO|nr:cellular retinoic acid-binding protein 1-like [Scleropages formosus]